MIVTVFRSRLNAAVRAEYEPVAARMWQLAHGMPGFVSAKSFVAEDGERVTLVEFVDEASQRAWRQHDEHLQAQTLGRKRFYSEFKLQVCTLLREIAFKNAPPA